MKPKYDGPRADCYEEGLFPFSNKGTPDNIRCDYCHNAGWGPILRNNIWVKVARYPHLVDRQGSLLGYVCEPCMVKKLGRALRSSDLADCPANYLHKAYKPHGYNLKD
jgi:hypothetical protein